MATKSLNSPKKSKLRTMGIILLLIIAAIAVYIFYNLASYKGNAQLGAGYASHVMCSCRYIQGRSLEDCKKDFEPGMEIVSLSDDPDNKRLSASVIFLSKAVAEHRGDFGCVQLSEEEIDAL